MPICPCIKSPFRAENKSRKGEFFVNLEHVLKNPEMDLFFRSLPEDVQNQLMERKNQIHSSNELYYFAENILKGE